MSVEFVDTNVLTYAYGDPGDRRSDAARALLEQLAKEHKGAVSIQVLQEFWVTLTRKVNPPVEPDVARARLTALGRWRVYTPTTPDVIEATLWEARFKIHFWDAMILLSAKRVGASVVWSEDLNDSQSYAGVTVRNPFQM